MTTAPITAAEFPAALEIANSGEATTFTKDDGTVVTVAPTTFILTRGGRTGKKVHLASANSSSTRCGHWTKFQMRHFKVTAAAAEQIGACSKCFA